MKQTTIDIIACTDCNSQLTLKEFSKNDKELLEGVFTCKTCGSWFPVTDGIGNMLPEHLASKKAREEFVKKWSFKAPKKKARKNEMSDADKMKQINFYNEDCDEYDENLESTPFWKSNDWNCIKRWVAKTKTGDQMLDIGCGTGRASFPFARRGVNVIGFDISEGMIKEAREKAIKLGIHENMDYLIGDAENPPFKEGCFDQVIVFGVLHHVPAPIKVLGSISKMLKPNGRYFGHENNKSKLRWIFDLSMKFYKLWNEEAGNHPLIAQDELREWGAKAGLKITSITSVYLPPHLYNLVGYRNAKSLMVLSDNICNSLPFIKGNGGALIIEGRKI
jgi:2-polyprenyl-3-methyl-5-hydroxy-6-metoxy-1,4-benzoquinol methylase/uncharacterized protein YbaR (Trm112 family)